MTTWQGWQRFATIPPPQPPAPGEPERGVEERLAYHSAFVTVRTPAIDTLTTSVRTLMLLGRHQQTTARPSLIVTGPAAAGKTTALLHVGRACHLAHTAQHPPAATTHVPVPVAYVLVPPGATAKALATEFARYLGIPATARMTQAQITDAVCHTYNRAGVRLVLIDEIHRLNPRTTTGAETADLLKDLTERIGATFVYAGIDVTGTALFSGVRGAQLAGRASLVECGAFPARLGTREPFRELIAGVEAALDLRAHRAGTLARHAAYLHQRTAGRIGSLTRLIRQAAITAILEGSERITKTSLDQVRLDHLAETHHHTTRDRQPNPR
ncbi:TniB family NTP-binding protein (plasmid) [Streptomyces sp. NBC_00257]|uniref:TniB family NTP-binding protein n=1 Tax=unclassified Streptomyces TaxID=2593676 RepID=UPI002258FD2B|nr:MULTISPECIES: TniB family NTP-binding protein [unclassified Streptomyces]MCX5426183.1 TniB family NTP-binding protein [Streptomyces sp. NBC_00062]MCX5434033.1 TniB family NTP-binding protein [Streptomyces sp. NBC_00062]MCX5434444.1 TniB family NTP-binding protein [Streptomyces sp. NBC_00062]